MIMFTAYNPLAEAISQPVTQQIAIEAEKISHVAQAQDRRCRVHLVDGREFTILEGLQDVSDQIVKWRDHQIEVRVAAEAKYKEQA